MAQTLSSRRHWLRELSVLLAQSATPATLSPAPAPPAGPIVGNEDIYEAKHEIKLPVKWTAPEAIRANKFSIKSDVWSFGILLFEIITYGQVPYSGMAGAQVIQMLLQDYRLPQPPNCPLPFYNIMLECWNAEPKERPKFEELYWKLEDYFETESSYADANSIVR
ncbi:hypothetical protein QTO34_001203 [Cnephaeus nilssonii]|uniref:Protein kinase domain-containing protein n=1 Tax=Cnephaeus nilssonii TaxID=3371016 RepID=A0AA40HVL7_CNENI|nr:hypothetical protein QTO34_001203 [Eptesicus nilssonii]